MTPTEIAKEYLRGKKLATQIAEFSQTSLARKFGIRTQTVAKVIAGQPTAVSEEDQRLIRECYAEAWRMQREYAGLTMEALCGRHGVNRRRVKRELELMGEGS